MYPDLPSYARGDSIGIAVCPVDLDIDQVEIDMLLYTTANGPQIHASTRGRGIPIEKGADRAVLNVPPSESLRLDPGIVTLETTYTLQGGRIVHTLIDRILTLCDAKIVSHL